MIKKVFLLTVFLSIIYLLVIRFFPTTTAIPESPWFKNELKVAQLSKLENKKPALALVGTSLSNVIWLDAINSNSINLALAGHTSLDGIKLLKYNHIIPDTLLVEVNFGNFDTTGWVSKYLSKSPLHFNSNYLNKPVVYFTGKTVDALNYNYIPFARTGEYTDSAYVRSQLTEIKTGNVLQHQIVDLNNYVEALNKELEFFNASSTLIVFFLTPYNPAICDDASFDQIRTAYTSAFENYNCIFLFHPDCTPYFTYDGRHLTYKEGETYTNYLKMTLAQHN